MTPPDPARPAPWTPDQPLLADATDDQLHDRIAWLERDSGLYIRGGRRAAREYAAACVEAARREWISASVGGFRPVRPASEREALATLLPCPWCGELPDVRQRWRGRPIRYFTEVICTNMPDCPVMASVSDREEAVAIAAWNRRAGWRRDGASYRLIELYEQEHPVTIDAALSAGRPIPTEEK